MRLSLKKLKEIRKLNKFSQSEMAKRLGVSQANYGRRETGQVDVTVRELELISKALNVNLSVFFEFETERGDTKEPWGINRGDTKVPDINFLKARILHLENVVDRLLEIKQTQINESQRLLESPFQHGATTKKNGVAD